MVYLKKQTVVFLSREHFYFLGNSTEHYTYVAHGSPQNLLAGFWVCFKHLLTWVYGGVCPNYFITENMFLDKVQGEAQKKLFTQLHYEFVCERYNISSYQLFWKVH